MPAIDNTRRDGLRTRPFASHPTGVSTVHPRSAISGFTLLELLAAISILGILVVMIAQIFGESDKAWNNGTGRAVNNSEGRAALNMIVRDLELAVSDNILTFSMSPDRNNQTTYGFADSEINFVSLKNNSEDGTRTAREIQYWVSPDTRVQGRYQLARSEVSAAITCYSDPLWYTQPRSGGLSYAVVAENVVALGFYTPDGNPFYTAGGRNALTNTPAYVDVYLEIMNERESKQLYELKRRFSENSTQCREFAERNARRYTARVFFQNRQGYSSR